LGPGGRGLQQVTRPTTYRVGRTDAAIEDLDHLEKVSRPLRREAERLIRGLAADPFQGYSLHHEWLGCRGLHFGGDKYRLIWEVMPIEEDYRGGDGDKVTPVLVLRVGPKKDAHERVIYDQPRPAAD
jgi:hypothetical protein